MPKLSVVSNASSSSNAAALLGLSGGPTLTNTTGVLLNSNNSSNISFFNGKSSIDFLTAAEQFQKYRLFFCIYKWKLNFLFLDNQN